MIKKICTFASMNLKKGINLKKDGMKKLLSLFVTLLTIFAPSNKVWAETNIPGLTYNEEGQYYEIPDAAALNTLSAFVNNGNTCEGLTFKQTNAITLTEDFVPIGEHKSPSFCMFSGTYDGNNQTICGLSVNGDYPTAGLFGYLFKATGKERTPCQSSHSQHE